MSEREGMMVWAGKGFVKGFRGVYRIVVAATSREEAAEALGLLPLDFQVRYSVSRSPQDLALYQGEASVGDIFASPMGRSQYEQYEVADIEA